MSRMKLKRYQFNSLPFVTIVDDVDCPVDPYVSCYLNGPLSGKAANTRVRHANELLFVLSHFVENKIDLPARFASSEFITELEYMQFYDKCCFQKGMLEESSVALFPSINDKRLRNIIAANQRCVAKVKNETLQGRIRRLRQFASWLFEQFHDAYSLDEATHQRFIKLVAKIKIDENSLGRNRTDEVGDPESSVIPDAIFAQMLEMVRPSSPNNPFKASKIRNYLIVNLLMQSGIRRGAMAKLKISDFHFYGFYDQISIYRSGNDPTETRLEKAKQKTKAHLATIHPNLMRQIQFYIDHVRSEIPNTAGHDFVFISEKDSKGTLGLELSLKTINAIFQKLSDALGFHVHPHKLRHKWNETAYSDEIGHRFQSNVGHFLQRKRCHSVHSKPSQSFRSMVGH